MLKKTFSLIFFIWTAVSVFSFQWPVKDPSLITTFGENKSEEFTKGIDIQSASDDIKPISDGEVVFYYRNSGNMLDMPSPLGNFIVLQHDRGIYSFYAHLEQIQANKEAFLFSTKDSIGKIGATGACEGTFLHLVVLDGEFEQFVNPLLSLPPLQDTIKPEIHRLFLVGKEEKEELKAGMVLKTGRYEIQAEIWDFSDNVGYYCPLTPYSIDLYINGELKNNLKFESLKLRDNDIVLQNSKISFNDLYKGQWLFTVGILDFSPGDTRIEISVKDFEGNETVRIFGVMVTE